MTEIRIVGWRTGDERESGEERSTPSAEVAASHVWGLLSRGCDQIIVERLGPDGRLAFEPR